jgi:lysozyme
MIKGIDISSWQGDMNFDVSKKNGVEFVFLRALFGETADRLFLSNLTKAQKSGMLCGTYFFPIKHLDISKQIKYFVNLIGYLDLDLPPAIDIEEYFGKSLDINDVEFTIKSIEDYLGVTPVIYTSYSMWYKTGAEISAWVSGCPLWLASWNTDVSELIIPNPWSLFTFWQTDIISNGSDYGTAPYNSIDIDYYNGTLESLKSLKTRLSIRR